MSTVKDAVTTAGHKVVEKVEGAANAVAECTNKTAEYVKEKVGMGGCSADNKGVGAIRERMEVFASCGTKVGVVDHVDGAKIKLTRKDSSDGEHHFVPLSNVAKVDEHVHLKINSKEYGELTKTGACGC